MTTASSAVAALQAKGSLLPLRWQHGEGRPFIDCLIFSADGGSVVARLPNRLGREQTDADVAYFVLAVNEFAALVAALERSTDFFRRHGITLPIRAENEDVLARIRDRAQEVLDG